MTATYRLTAYRAGLPTRDRLLSALLALALVALLIAVLIRMSGYAPGRQGEGRTMAFSFLPDGRDDKPAVEQEQQREAQREPQKSPPPPPARQSPVVVPEAQVVLPNLPGLLVLSRDDFRKTDIGKIKGTGQDRDAEQVADAGGSAGGGIPGAAPGGETLYPAEWYREPTRAEMATYLPYDRGEGWGIIACKTIPRNRVEDCRQLAESPGSGIGRGLRQAAWQFQILPPRVNGKPLIGVWVRIRFDLLKGVEK